MAEEKKSTLSQLFSLHNIGGIVLGGVTVYFVQKYLQEREEEKEFIAEQRIRRKIESDLASSKPALALNPAPRRKNNPTVKLRGFDEIVQDLRSNPGRSGVSAFDSSYDDYEEEDDYEYYR